MPKEVMTDEEVGKLWRERIEAGPGAWSRITLGLIRKLVDERAKYHQDVARAAVCGYCSDSSDWEYADRELVEAEGNACAEFGIPVDEFNNH